MRRFILYLLPLFVLMSCNKGDFLEIVRLGAVEKEMTVSSGAVEDTIKLVTNMPYKVQVVEGNEWLNLAATGEMPSSRLEIPFRCQENISWRRMAKVTLSANERTDTVYIRQEGPLRDRLYLNDSEFDVPAEGGTYTTAVECFRYPDGVMVEVSSPMLTASVSGGILTVRVAPTKSRDPKTYTASVYYIDGWGEHASAVVTFNQKPKK